VDRLADMPAWPRAGDGVGSTTADLTFDVIGPDFQCFCSSDI